MIPDAFGWDFVNNRLLCDQYAEKGFLVYLPDFMGGELASSFLPLPTSFALMFLYSAQVRMKRNEIELRTRHGRYYTKDID